MTNDIQPYAHIVCYAHGEQDMARTRIKSKARKSVEHTVKSLDVSSIAASDYVDLSYATCTLSASRSPGAVQLGFLKDASGRHIPFPHGTHGFFYCAHSEAHPPLAAELRFRITDGPTPEYFALGRDLLTRTRQPWRISVLYMLSQRSYAGLVDLLIRQGAINVTVKKLAWSHMAYSVNTTGKPSLPRETSRVIHSFKQPFVWDLDERPAPFAIWSVSSSRIMRASSFQLLQHLVGSSAETAPGDGHVLSEFAIRVPIRGKRTVPLTLTLSMVIDSLCA